MSLTAARLRRPELAPDPGLPVERTDHSRRALDYVAAHQAKDEQATVGVRVACLMAIVFGLMTAARHLTPDWSRDVTHVDKTGTAEVDLMQKLLGLATLEGAMLLMDSFCSRQLLRPTLLAYALGQLGMAAVDAWSWRSLRSGSLPSAEAWICTVSHGLTGMVLLICAVRAPASHAPRTPRRGAFWQHQLRTICCSGLNLALTLRVMTVVTAGAAMVFMPRTLLLKTTLMAPGGTLEHQQRMVNLAMVAGVCRIAAGLMLLFRRSVSRAAKAGMAVGGVLTACVLALLLRSADPFSSPYRLMLVSVLAFHTSMALAAAYSAYPGKLPWPIPQRLTLPMMFPCFFGLVTSLIGLGIAVFARERVASAVTELRLVRAAAPGQIPEVSGANGVQLLMDHLTTTVIMNGLMMFFNFADLSFLKLASLGQAAMMFLYLSLAALQIHPFLLHSGELAPGLNRPVILGKLLLASAFLPLAVASFVSNPEKVRLPRWSNVTGSKAKFLACAWAVLDCIHVAHPIFDPNNFMKQYDQEYQPAQHTWLINAGVIEGVVTVFMFLGVLNSCEAAASSQALAKWFFAKALASLSILHNTSILSPEQLLGVLQAQGVSSGHQLANVVGFLIAAGLAFGVARNESKRAGGLSLPIMGFLRRFPFYRLWGWVWVWYAGLSGLCGLAALHRATTGGQHTDALAEPVSRHSSEFAVLQLAFAFLLYQCLHKAKLARRALLAIGSLYMCLFLFGRSSYVSEGGEDGDQPSLWAGRMIPFEQLMGAPAHTSESMWLLWSAVGCLAAGLSIPRAPGALTWSSDLGRMRPVQQLMWLASWILVAAFFYLYLAPERFVMAGLALSSRAAGGKPDLQQLEVGTGEDGGIVQRLVVNPLAKLMSEMQPDQAARHMHSLITGVRILGAVCLHIGLLVNLRLESLRFCKRACQALLVCSVLAAFQSWILVRHHQQEHAAGAAGPALQLSWCQTSCWTLGGLLAAAGCWNLRHVRGKIAPNLWQESLCSNVGGCGNANRVFWITQGFMLLLGLIYAVDPVGSVQRSKDPIQTPLGYALVARISLFSVLSSLLSLASRLENVVSGSDAPVGGEPEDVPPLETFGEEHSTDEEFSSRSLRSSSRSLFQRESALERPQALSGSSMASDAGQATQRQVQRAVYLCGAVCAALCYFAQTFLRPQGSQSPHGWMLSTLFGLTVLVQLYLMAGLAPSTTDGLQAGPPPQRVRATSRLPGQQRYRLFEEEEEEDSGSESDTEEEDEEDLVPPPDSEEEEELRKQEDIGRPRLRRSKRSSTQRSTRATELQEAYTTPPRRPSTRGATAPPRSSHRSGSAADRGKAGTRKSSGSHRARPQELEGLTEDSGHDSPTNKPGGHNLRRRDKLRSARRSLPGEEESGSEEHSGDEAAGGGIASRLRHSAQRTRRSLRRSE